MTLDDRANLAQNGRVACRRIRSRQARRRGQILPMLGGVAPILMAGSIFATAAPASDTPPTPTAAPRAEAAPVPPPARPPEIPPQLLQPAPAIGKGRLQFVIGG